MNDFEKEVREMFSDVWNMEIDNPRYQDTVGDLMKDVIKLYNSKHETKEYDLDQVKTNQIITTQNYNAEKLEISYKLISLSFKEITLLSIEEYLKNTELIHPSKGVWWLRSPGRHQVNTAFVHMDGYLDYRYVGQDSYVRPALKILNCHNLIPGDKIRISEHTFTVLHGNLALCDTCVGESIFDNKFNNFETSVIRKYLYNWAEENNITFEKE